MAPLLNVVLGHGSRSSSLVLVVLPYIAVDVLTAKPTVYPILATKGVPVAMIPRGLQHIPVKSTHLKHFLCISLGVLDALVLSSTWSPFAAE